MPGGSEEFIEVVASLSRLVADPRRRWPLSNDPDDDYLIALAQMTGATLVTGDRRIHTDHPHGLVVTGPADLLKQLADIVEYRAAGHATGTHAGRTGYPLSGS